MYSLPECFRSESNSEPLRWNIKVCSHERPNELKPVWDFISVENLISLFSRCSVLVFTWIEVKWNSKRYGFHIGHFDRNDISFRVIKYYVNTARNEMPTHVHRNTGSLWNAAKIKYHVNRTCVQAGSGMSSFRLSCGRTVRRIFMRRLFTGTARQLFSLKIPSQTFHWVWIPLCR